MTEKELKRLSRAELLGLLLDEVKKNEALESRVKELQERLDECNLLSSAQAASEQYLETVQKLSDKQDEFLNKLEAEFNSMNDIRVVNERIDKIIRDQKELRSLMASHRKGARR